MNDADTNEQACIGPLGLRFVCQLRERRPTSSPTTAPTSFSVCPDSFQPDLSERFYADAEGPAPQCLSDGDFQRLEDLMVLAYNNLVEDKCDPNVRQLQSVEVSLADSEDVSTCSVEPVSDRNRVGYIVKFFYTCRCDDPNLKIFDERDGSFSIVDTFLPLEDLVYGDNCRCTNSGATNRGPTMDEFGAALNTLIEESDFAGLVRIKNYGEGCPAVEQRTYSTTIFIGAIGQAPECLTPEEFSELATEFVESYNELVSENCDPDFRSMFNATWTLASADIDTSSCDDRRRQLVEGRMLTTSSTTYKGEVGYGCTCENDQLVSDASGRRRELRVDDPDIPRIQPNRPTFYSQFCLCQSDEPSGRAPTFSEKQERLNTRLAAVGIPGLSALADVGTGCPFATSDEYGVTLDLVVTGLDPGCLDSPDIGKLQATLKNIYNSFITAECDSLFRDMKVVQITIDPADQAGCARRRELNGVDDVDGRHLSTTITYSVAVTFTCRCDTTPSLFDSSSRFLMDDNSPNRFIRHLTVYTDFCTCGATTPLARAPSTSEYVSLLNAALLLDPVAGITSINSITVT